MITQHYQLNLIPTGKDPVIVRCSQYDKDSRAIEFSLFNGKELFALGDGYTVTVRGTKQDGNAFEYDCSIVDTNAVFSINQQMTLFAGKFPCELRIMVGDEILGSANFYLYVEKSPMDEDSAISESDLPAYERLLADVQSKNVSDWLEENISQETGYVIDTSLTVSGAAADAKAVGNEIQRLEAEIEGGGSGGSGGTTNYNDLSNKPRINNVPLEGNKTAEELGLVVSSSISDDLKQALLQLAQKVAYIDAGGTNYYQDLYDALYPSAVLTSITAAYTQSGTVYTGDTLDSLKPDLTVTANYDDGTSETVTNYTLSGNLTAGTSVITVTYRGKTTTFDVTVTRVSGTYSISNNLTGCSNSNSATTVAEGASYTGTITANTGYTLTGATVSITMGGNDVIGYYSNGTISIPNVTGDVVITVVATAVTLSSISAVYTQSGTVYNTAELDSLKDDLVVTGTYSNGTTSVIPSSEYTLSGTLVEGTSTITVTYLNKTDTFNVTVSAVPDLFSLASLTGTVAGTEEVDTGVKMREHATVTIMLTLEEVIGWNWKSQALFSTGSTLAGDTIQLSCSGNGGWSLNLSSGHSLGITDYVFPQTNSNGVKNAPLIVVFENMNTTRITVTAYGYLLNEVVSNTNSFNKALNIGAGNLLLAPTTDHFYNAGSHFGGILTNIRVLDRVPSQAEILAYCEEAAE